MKAFEQWWKEYTSKDGNETLSDYEKEPARDAWLAAVTAAVAAIGKAEDEAASPHTMVHIVRAVGE